MSDITVINDSQQSELVTNGLAKNGELYLKAAGSTDAGAIVVYDSGSWRTFANEAVSFQNQYSVSFDGTDDNLTTAYQYASATQFTYSFWIKTTDTTGIWIGNDPVGNSDMRAHIGAYNGNYTIDLGNSTGSQYRNRSVSASAVLDGNWHHLVFQWDGTATNGVKMFVDGNTTPVLTQTSTVASNASPDPLRFGIGHSSFWAYNGLMDEVAIWESILTTSDITTLYNSGVPADISSLSPVGWWRMGDNDGGTGTTVTDQGSGSNNGTLTNGAAFSTTVPS